MCIRIYLIYAGLSTILWSVLNLAIQLSSPSFLLSIGAIEVFWHGPYVMKFCNLCCVFHHGMVDDMKQVRKSCNLHHLFRCGMVYDGEFSIIFCNCLCMVDNRKLTWVT